MSCFSLTGYALMDLRDAVDAHLLSSLQLSAFGDRRQLIQMGPLTVLRDAPGRKRPPRLQSIMICEVAPAEAMKTVLSYDPTHWILCVFDGMDADHEAIKTTYKAFGYRLNIRFPVFVRDVKKEVPKEATGVKRVTEQSDADAIGQIKGRKLLPPAAWLGDDPMVRIYAAYDGNKVIGWVQSVRATEVSNWVSDLFVVPEFRGRGVGKSLLHSMLREDQAHGVKNSSLLSSSDGRTLYPKVGYVQIGLMQIFAPIKKRG